MSGRAAIVAVADSRATTQRLREELREDSDELTISATVPAALTTLARWSDLAPLEKPAAVAVLCEPLPGASSTLQAAGALRGQDPELQVIALSPRPDDPELAAAVRQRLLYRVLPLPWRPGELRDATLCAHEYARTRAQFVHLQTRMQRRLGAISAVNEIVTDASELSAYEDVAKVLARGVVRVARFDVGAVMLAVDLGGSPVLHLHVQERCDEQLLRSTRDRCLELLRSMTGRDIDETQLTVRISGEPVAEGCDAASIGSSIYLPIKVDGRVAGLFLLASHHSNAFTADDERLLDSLTSRTSEAIARMAMRLHDERSRLRHMVESMADGLIMTDLKSDEVTINPAAKRMLGISDDLHVTTQFLKDKLGFYPFDLVVAQRTSGLSSQPLREEVRIGDRLLHSIVSPVVDGARKLVGVVVVLRDMTEAKELARRQQEFVSVVSHELRTPLTSITGALDIVLSDYAGRLADKQRRYLQMARDSCKRLNLIVDDLLDVARSESGHMSIHFAPLALDELSREVVERYRPAAQAKGIALEVKSEGHPIRIVGDPDRLTQVLNNLLSNAIKFTPGTGLIEVEIFGLSVAANHVGVSVYNNGDPIPESDHERIFDKFEQLQASSTRRVGGTGLGLAISRAIIEAHRGRIWVEPREDGTKFVFTLPAAPEAEAVPDEGISEFESGPTAVGESEAVVLIVDDDVHSIYILKGLLMASGYEVLLAENADAALTLARTRHPNLVVVDSSMQDGQGLALVEIFKHDPDTRKTAVLVIDSEPQRERALRAGAAEFSVKPIEPTLFRETCARLIAEAGRARAPRILVVDDEPAVRIICRDVLENANYTVRTVANGATAIAEAKRFRPDILLVDVMMPDMDGFETAAQLRREPCMSMTPIIFVSAKGETADKVRAFRVGAEDYVVKPFNAAELVARVGKALERHSREVGASPTTQLPGADAIEAEIERRLAEDKDHAFCYLDLDNLKAFNDYYGYAKADGVIRQTGDLIRDMIGREGNPSDFIGHIAGDDFVFITSADRVERVCTSICQAFDRLVPLYYNKLDRERGYIETKDRYGILRKFPIMGVSLSVVTLGKSKVKTFSELATTAAAGKKLAKVCAGSAYVCDGNLVLGTPPEQSEDSEVSQLA